MAIGACRSTTLGRSLLQRSSFQSSNVKHCKIPQFVTSSSWELPIHSMLECMSEQMMDWFARQHNSENNTQGMLVSKIAKKYPVITRSCMSIPSQEINRGTFYEVNSMETQCKYLVDFEMSTCSCFIWQTQGFPRGHWLSLHGKKIHNIMLSCSIHWMHTNWRMLAP